MELSQATKKLLSEYQAWYQSLEPKEAVATISVDEVAARIAEFYEKIRGVVDWREEHLLRKTAIERIFKRRVLVGGQTKDIAEPFLQELIRGGHFPNNVIPITKIEEIQAIVDKYFALINESKPYVEKKSKGEFEDWFLTLAACEIEENLDPRMREKALIECMSNDMLMQIQLRKRDENKITPEERMLAIFIGVQRALYKLDEPSMQLHILQKFYPEWNHLSQNSIFVIAPQIKMVKARIDAIFKHPLIEKIYRIIEQHDTPYLLLGDIMAQDPKNFEITSQETSQFEAFIQKAYNVRLQKLKARMNRAAIFSTISVFVSKVLIALVVEVLIIHESNYTNLLWGVAIPPIFLLVLLKTVKFSTPENFQRTLLEVTKITFETERKNIYEISFPRKPNVVVEGMLNLMYLLSFVVSFGILAYILRQFKWSIASIVIFLMFFSLVTYAGTRIRARSRELIVGKPKEGFLHGVLEFFGLPIIQAGKWLSGQISRFNIIVLMLNIFIESPFQIFVEFVEHIRGFWQEKKEEIH